MRSFKHALGNSRIGQIDAEILKDGFLELVILLSVGLFFFSSGCDAPQAPQTTTTTTPVTQAAPTLNTTVSAPIDTPYNYAGTQTANNGCWENQVRTNGPSFGASGNSGYLCTGGGASYSNSPYPAYPNDVTWIGFYRDGTISLRDQAGIDHTYTAFLPYGGIPCELDLKDQSNNTHAIIGPVNYPGYPTYVLDSQDHMNYMEIQTYVNGTLDSGSIWTCEYAPAYGVQ